MVRPEEDKSITMTEVSKVIKLHCDVAVWAKFALIF